MFSVFEHTCFQRSANSESNRGRANRRPGGIILGGGGVDGAGLAFPAQRVGRTEGRAIRKGKRADLKDQRDMEE